MDHMCSDFVSHVAYTLQMVLEIKSENNDDDDNGDLLVVEVLDDALNVQMLVPVVGQRLFNAKLERLSCHTQVLDMIVFELFLALLLLLIID